MKDKYVLTAESVTEGHPDKLCDTIADSILDACLKEDPNARVACEVLATAGKILVAGELRTTASPDVEAIVRQTVRNAGYDCNYHVEVRLHTQSPDIAEAVDGETLGAGDQGMMFGFACDETPEYMPTAIAFAHRLTRRLTEVRKNGTLPWLRPDGKAQVTIAYEDGQPVAVDTIVISTQHDDFVAEGLGNITYSEAVRQFGQDKVDQAMHDKIEADVRNILLPKLKTALNPQTAALFKDDFILHVNPTGKFVIGGPAGDTGLTGRKIIVDTYGGKGAHGGGAFSGKDPSKVDRSAAYAARHIAKNMVAAGVADEMLVQVAYAIGVARPVSIFVDTYGTGIVPDAEIARKIEDLFDLRPAAIIRKFELKNPIYEPTAAYGHFGRKPYTKTVKVGKPGHQNDKLVQFFGWEKLDAVDAIKKAFNL